MQRCYKVVLLLRCRAAEVVQKWCRGVEVEVKVQKCGCKSADVLMCIRLKSC